VAELSGRTVTYGYDNVYKLTQETITSDPASINGTIGYTYDDVGNRLTRTATVAGITNQAFIYDADDRLTTDTYSANGNTIGSNGKTYTYDFENHLTQVNDPANGLITYAYDGNGNRVSKMVGGTTTQYLVTEINPTGYSQVVEELQNGSVVKKFAYGSDLISQTVGGMTHFYGYDGHGNERFLTDGLGAVTDTYDYDAFGSAIHSTGNTDNPYRYTGERLDAETGLYHLRARQMDPGTGRFISQDEYQGRRFEPKTLHKYSYADNDSVNKSDPSGYMTLVEVGTGLAIEDIIFQFTASALSLNAAAGILAKVKNAVRKSEPNWVVRGGEARPEQLIAGTNWHRAVPGLSGFSVQYQPGKEINELAAAGDFFNPSISVATDNALEVAALGVGYSIGIIPSPGHGYHHTIEVPFPLPLVLASALSSVFQIMPNPFQRRRI
jgi:RHS repeat-associated protein